MRTTIWNPKNPSYKISALLKESDFLIKDTWIKNSYPSDQYLSDTCKVEKDGSLTTDFPFWSEIIHGVDKDSKSPFTLFNTTTSSVKTFNLWEKKYYKNAAFSAIIEGAHINQGINDIRINEMKFVIPMLRFWLGKKTYSFKTDPIIHEDKPSVKTPVVFDIVFKDEEISFKTNNHFFKIPDLLILTESLMPMLNLFVKPHLFEIEKVLIRKNIPKANNNKNYMNKDLTLYLKRLEIKKPLDSNRSYNGFSIPASIITSEDMKSLTNIALKRQHAINRIAVDAKYEEEKMLYRYIAFEALHDYKYEEIVYPLYTCLACGLKFKKRTRIQAREKANVLFKELLADYRTKNIVNDILDLKTNKDNYKKWIEKAYGHRNNTAHINLSFVDMNHQEYYNTSYSTEVFFWLSFLLEANVSEAIFSNYKNNLKMSLLEKIPEYIKKEKVFPEETYEVDHHNIECNNSKAAANMVLQNSYRKLKVKLKSFTYFIKRI